MNLARTPGRALRALRPPMGPDPAALIDWHRLRRDPLWGGDGVPHGNGEPVLLVPGMGAPSRVMGPLNSWLTRIGYEPHIADVKRGLDCSERTATHLTVQLEALAARASSQVVVIAHSRGGQFARVALRRRPDLPAGLMTLGTPFDLLGLHPVVKAQAAVLGVAGTAGVPNLVRIGCVRGRCCAAFRRDFVDPWPGGIPFVSVYSRADRTVRWRSCVEPSARNVEVETSHTGLLVSCATYAAIASFAADAVGS